MSSLRRFLTTYWLGRWLLLPYRLTLAFKHQARSSRHVLPWLWRSREIGDFSYDLTRLNLEYLAEFLSLVTGLDARTAQRYLAELDGDEELREHVRRATLRSGYLPVSDVESRPGKRLAWYVLVRAAKPRIVVEAGVNRGLGACILAAALRRNIAEGHAGKVYSVDLDPTRGYLFSGPYAEVGELVAADIRQFLTDFDETIDMFIHDTQNDPVLEEAEYRSVEPKLAAGALVCSVWASAEILAFARRTGRSCLDFAMESRDHWYPGARLAVAFPPVRESLTSADTG